VAHRAELAADVLGNGGEGGSPSPRGRVSFSRIDGARGSLYYDRGFEIRKEFAMLHLFGVLALSLVLGLDLQYGVTPPDTDPYPGDPPNNG
jgi:hypothetical protein